MTEIWNTNPEIIQAGVIIGLIIIIVLVHTDG